MSKNDVQLNAFPLRLGTRQGFLLVPLISKTVIFKKYVSASTTQQQKEIEGMHVRMKRVKLVHIIVCTETPNESTKSKKKKRTNKLSKATEYKI